MTLGQAQGNALARRLERLRPALSVKERFLMALDQYKNGSRFAVDLSDLSPAQHDEYMGYARLVVAFNLMGGTFLPLVSWRAGCLAGDLNSVANLEEAACELERAAGLPLQKPPKYWRKHKGEIAVSAFLRGLADEQRAFLTREADRLWLELEAVRELHEEALSQIGEDPAQPATASAAAEASLAVSELRARLGLKKAPRPDAAITRQYSEYMSAIGGADDLELPR